MNPHMPLLPSTDSCKTLLLGLSPAAVIINYGTTSVSSVPQLLIIASIPTGSAVHIQLHSLLPPIVLFPLQAVSNLQNL